MTQTRIIATLGPASRPPEMLRALIEAGVDIFRINFAHGTRSLHRQMARAVRSVASEIGREVGLLGDLAGPKIRCGPVEPDPLHLVTGMRVTLTHEDIIGSERLVPITYGRLVEDVQPGQQIALDDGRIRLRVESIEPPYVRCVISEGGQLRSNKGVNLPETELRVSAMGEEDRESIALAVEEGFDFLGLSFVGSAADVEEARAEVRSRGGNLLLIAKIERRAAMPRLDEILRAADGAMVARGDLGVELPVEQVPLIQKRIIRACNHLAKPVITATQMLESMLHSPRPTRAEVSDIANAILDGTDAVMLSGETAVGEYPVETVRTMDRIAETAEEALDHRKLLAEAADCSRDENAAISLAASQLAHELELEAIVCVTAGGSTPRRIAPHRPHCAIIAASASLAIVRQTLISWGVEPVCLPEIAGSLEPDCVEAVEPADAWVRRVLRLCARAGKVRAGQRVAFVAGIPIGRPGTTNFVHVTIVPAE